MQQKSGSDTEDDLVIEPHLTLFALCLLALLSTLLAKENHMPTSKCDACISQRGIQRVLITRTLMELRGARGSVAVHVFMMACCL